MKKSIIISLIVIGILCATAGGITALVLFLRGRGDKTESTLEPSQQQEQTTPSPTPPSSSTTLSSGGGGSNSNSSSSTSSTSTTSTSSTQATSESPIQTVPEPDQAKRDREEAEKKQKEKAEEEKRLSKEKKEAERLKAEETQKEKERLENERKGEEAKAKERQREEERLREEAKAEELRLEHLREQERIQTENKRRKDDQPKEEERKRKEELQRTEYERQRREEELRKQEDEQRLREEESRLKEETRKAEQLVREQERRNAEAKEREDDRAENEKRQRQRERDELIEKRRLSEEKKLREDEKRKEEIRKSEEQIRQARDLEERRLAEQRRLAKEAQERIDAEKRSLEAQRLAENERMRKEELKREEEERERKLRIAAEEKERKDKERRDAAERQQEEERKTKEEREAAERQEREEKEKREAAKRREEEERKAIEAEKERQSPVLKDASAKLESAIRDENMEISVHNKLSALSTSLSNILAFKGPLGRAVSVGLAMLLSRHKHKLPQNILPEVGNLIRPWNPSTDGIDDMNRYNHLKAVIKPLDDATKHYTLRCYFVNSMRVDYSEEQINDIRIAFEASMHNGIIPGLNEFFQFSRQQASDKVRPIDRVFGILLTKLPGTQLALMKFTDADLRRHVSPASLLLMIRYWNPNISSHTVVNKALPDLKPEYHSYSAGADLFLVEYFSPVQIESSAEATAKRAKYVEERTLQLQKDPNSLLTILAVLSLRCIYCMNKKSWHEGTCSVLKVKPALKPYLSDLWKDDELKRQHTFDEVIERIKNNLTPHGISNFKQAGASVVALIEIEQQEKIFALQKKRLGNSIVAFLSASDGDTIHKLGSKIKIACRVAASSAVEMTVRVPATIVRDRSSEPNFTQVLYHPDALEQFPKRVDPKAPKHEVEGAGMYRDLIRIGISLMLTGTRQVLRRDGMWNPMLNPRAALYIGRLLGKALTLGVVPGVNIDPGILNFALGLSSHLDTKTAIEETIALIEDDFSKQVCKDGSSWPFEMVNLPYGDWTSTCQMQKVQADNEDNHRALLRKHLHENLETCSLAFIEGISLFYNLQRLYSIVFSGRPEVAADFVREVFKGSEKVDLDDFLSSVSLKFIMPGPAEAQYDVTFKEAIRELQAADEEQRLIASMEGVEVTKRPFLNRLLFFMTGSHVVPYGSCANFSPILTVELGFFVDLKRLPTTHTCGNQLDIPFYPLPTAEERKEAMKEKLMKAVDMDVGDIEDRI